MKNDTDFWGKPIAETKVRRASLTAADKKAYHAAWYQANREKAKAYYQTNLEKIKAYKKATRQQERFRAIKRKYGLSEEQWNALFNTQHRKCLICKTSKFKTKGPVIDHCAKVGHVRGILCNNCNTAIGLFNHDISLLAAAIQYLSKEVIFNHNGTGKGLP